MAERKNEHVLKLETKVTLGQGTPQFQLDKKRAAIKAALTAATHGLAATTSGLAAQAYIAAEDDGGTPPWGEVIIEPIWYEKNPQFGDILTGAGELRFWQ